MTRNNAREIAVHLVFSLNFADRSADEVLESELNRERFAALGQESLNVAAAGAVIFWQLRPQSEDRL